ncbi:hypothetical protein CSH63_05340 [Micromonospora tulbaghiae]|uniref:DUF3027 domain-containing protein n=1 Tax=Micromonospora tulbaghiae TaxID=479978 RepID=A0A386WFL3_9ACTN|nr:hypothetical protein CSH63_05340 [Micromonospora tulbaghiae]
MGRRRRGPQQPLPPASRSNSATATPSTRPTQRPWCDEQSGGCRLWIPVNGEVGHGYGACTNPASNFDGRVRFEHDGCTAFANRDDGSFG